MGLGSIFLFFRTRCIQEYKNMMANLSINNTTISPLMTKTEKKEIKLIVNSKESKRSEYTDYKEFFMNFKLNKRDYLHILLGGLLIGPSIILLHIVGMLAIGFNGYLVFNIPNQIWISILGAIACFVINIGFFYKDTLWVKFLMSLLVSATVFAVHCSSVHFTTFENSVSQTSFKQESYFVDLGICSNILFVTIALLNFIFREITNYHLNSSFLILQIIRNYISINDKNLSNVEIFINNFIKLKNQRVSSKIESDEKISKINFHIKNMKCICIIMLNFQMNQYCI
jgi:hypothetical protein